MDSGDSGTTVRVLFPTSPGDFVFGESALPASSKKRPADTH